MPEAPRRFPRPWSYEVKDESVIILAANGFRIAYLYHAQEDRARVMDRLFKEEAIAIARGIVRRVNEEGPANPSSLES